MIIQIYEIQTPEEAQAMINLGVHHIGSVVPTPADCRNPVLRETIKTVQSAGLKSSLIPLFTEENLIADCVRFYRPDILHLCEMLPFGSRQAGDIKDIVERQKRLCRMFPGLELMRSIPVAADGMGDQLPSLELADIFAPFSNWLLTDTYLTGPQDLHQPVCGYVGITGRTCDWRVVRQMVSASPIPVILAGGIGPANAYDGVVQVCPAGVDSCTQTNAVDDAGKPVRFKKNINRVRKMIAAVHKALDHLKSNAEKEIKNAGKR